MSRLVLFGPEKLEGRNGQDHDAIRFEVLGGPVQGSGIVRDVLEHVEHPHHVVPPWQRFGNPVTEDLELIASLPSKIVDGARFRLRSEHLAKSGQHRQVAAAAAPDLHQSKPFRGGWRRMLRDRGRDYLATRSPPPMLVLDGGQLVVDSSFQISGVLSRETRRAENESRQAAGTVLPHGMLVAERRRGGIERNVQPLPHIPFDPITECDELFAGEVIGEHVRMIAAVRIALVVLGDLGEVDVVGVESVSSSLARVGPDVRHVGFGKASS